jgi:hypothetical protein
VLDHASLFLSTQQDLDFDDDDDGEFSLPIDHRPSNNLNTEDLQQTSMDTPIGASNVGYKLLKKMGWKDQTGLGRDGAGIFEEGEKKKTANQSHRNFTKLRGKNERRNYHIIMGSRVRVQQSQGGL